MRTLEIFVKPHNVNKSATGYLYFVCLNKKDEMHGKINYKIKNSGYYKET